MQNYQGNSKNGKIVCTVLLLTFASMAVVVGILIAKASTKVIAQLSLGSTIFLWVIIGLFSLIMVVAWWWQFQVFCGKEMESSDGSVDSWHDICGYAKLIEEELIDDNEKSPK